MKAVVFEGVRDVAVKEVQDPKIERDDDILVKVTSTAICGSDLHLIGCIPAMYWATRPWASWRKRART